jgi:hypothetical protein
MSVTDLLFGFLLLIVWSLLSMYILYLWVKYKY